MLAAVPLQNMTAQQIMRLLPQALAGEVVLGLGLESPVEVPPGVAAVIATSGSTGTPKRVMLSAAALVSSAQATADLLGSGQWVLALPPGYIAGLQVLVRSHLAQTTPVVLDASFTTDEFVSATRAARDRYPDGPLFTALVPAQLQRLLTGEAEAAQALRAYRAVLVGGQAISPQLYQQALAAGVALVRTYGSSETSGGCVYDGTPLPGVLMRIDGEEIQLQSDALAVGYQADAALTEQVFVPDSQGRRWYRTGDAGTIENGKLQVLGRLDRVFISGGINVSLDRVQAAVRSVSGLGDAVVVAVPDAKWGQACVIVTETLFAGPEGQIILQQARQVTADQVGVAARPKSLISGRSIPLLASGKPDISALQTDVIKSGLTG